MDRAPAKPSRWVWIVPISALIAAGIATTLVATMDDPDPPTWNTESVPPPMATPPPLDATAEPAP